MFHMGAWEFYTKASITSEALSTTLFLKDRGMLGPDNTDVASLLLLIM